LSAGVQLGFLSALCRHNGRRHRLNFSDLEAAKCEPIEERQLADRTPCSRHVDSAITAGKIFLPPLEEVPMTRDEIGVLLLHVLREVQAISGRVWTDLDPNAKPIGSLDGFDSLSGVETTVMIEERVRCRLEVESLFVSDDGKRALTVQEIGDRLADLVGASGGRK
jgi:acyl carrier protein